MMDGISVTIRPEHPAQRLERGDGAAEIGFALSGGETRLDHLYQRAPCRVLRPDGAAGEPAGAVLVTTSGGLASGDRLRVSLTAGEGTAAQVTTQAAEKIYRAQRIDGADTPPAVFDCDLDVGVDAWLEWLPQETILFDGARLARRTRAEVPAGARLFACEHVVLGRIARGESFTNGLLFDRWEVTRGGAPLWCDAIELAGDIARVRNAPWGLAGAEAFATALFVADDAPGFLEAARGIMAAAVPLGALGGATIVNGMLIARFLGRAGPVRTGLGKYVAQFRAAAGGFAAELPRVWNT